MTPVLLTIRDRRRFNETEEWQHIIASFDGIYRLRIAPA